MELISLAAIVLAVSALGIMRVLWITRSISFRETTGHAVATAGVTLSVFLAYLLAARFLATWPY